MARDRARERGRLAAGAGAVASGALALLGWRAARRRRAGDLDGRVVLITGGSRGLGLALAREFADAGCDVALCARDPVELEAARADLARRGARVFAAPCDVASRDEVGWLVREVTRELGPIDVLVNNASVIQVGPLETMALEDFQTALAVNYWGTVHATLAVLPDMRARRDGRIVNVASIGGKVAVPHLLPYDCAKFAVLGFSEGLRAELAKDGIAVTTIVPGLMRTGSPLHASFKGQPRREFAWFSLGDLLPLTSMSAERAARRIVRATRRGEAEVVLSWQAKLLRLAHDLAPGLTADLLGLVNRALPSASGWTPATEGVDLRGPGAPPLLGGTLDRAAHAFNQLPTRSPSLH